jgi:hypothetical protein
MSRLDLKGIWRATGSARRGIRGASADPDAGEVGRVRLDYCETTLYNANNSTTLLASSPFLVVVHHW